MITSLLCRGTKTHKLLGLVTEDKSELLSLHITQGQPLMGVIEITDWLVSCGMGQVPAPTTSYRQTHG